jgi:two-component system sensor histidine kinase VanS
MLKQYGEWAIKLRNRKKSRGDYSRLKRKISSRMFLITASAIVIGIVSYLIMVGEDSTEYVIVKESSMMSVNSFGVFMFIIRRNKGFFLGLAVCLLILLRLFMHWFVKYFDEISAGMDQLVEETDGEITLSPELSSIEQKLNTIKGTLERQKRNAQEAERRKNDLVVYLAHDLKTPLTSIIGYLSLLDEAPHMPFEQRAKYTGVTLDKAFRLEQLINEFFEITRFNLQTIVLNKSKVNLPFMLQQIADEFYPILASQGKRAAVHAPDELTLWADADKLARVFGNILKNAISYSYANSTIYISAIQQGDCAVITFVNKGDPIPAQKLETIFERFYRLDSARSTNTGGSGLGLAIAKELVRAHDGTITVESSREQTIFRVALPIDTERRTNVVLRDS